jgi:hypothetical protein
VDIRTSEYQAEQKVLVWCPDIPVPCALISWSPYTRFNEIEEVDDFKALE